MGSRINNAINILMKGGDINEAVSVALGRKDVSAQGLGETGGGPAYARSVTWFAPDENAANQAMLLVQNKLGILGKLEAHTNGAQSGYAITWAGEIGDHDIASLLSSKGGCCPLAGDHAAQDL